MLASCAQLPRDDGALEPIDRGRLPPPDLTLEIAGLGPCTAQEDRSFSLNSQQPVVVLVHGCLASSGRFRSLAEVFALQGQQAICYEYNDRDSLQEVGHDLRLALDRLSQALDHQPMTLIGHSQGGLIARHALRDSGPAAPALLSSPQQLITLSSPFSGISAADHCASTTARLISVGLVVPICMLISGDKWYEITYASDFMRNPGSLNPGVQRHLLVKTDERKSCRAWRQARCLEDDYVFSLEEQALPSHANAPVVAKQVVRAGHAEIVGDSRTVPQKLIDLLQDAGILRRTHPSNETAFRQRLSEIFLAPPIASRQ